MNGDRANNLDCRACRRGSSSYCQYCLERQQIGQSLGEQDAKGGASWLEQKGADAEGVRKRTAQGAPLRRRGSR